MQSVSQAFLVLFLTIVLAGWQCTASAQDHHTGPAMNYHVIDDRLATSGHFTDGGLDRMASAGLELVIELREKPPAGRAEAMAKRGIEWVHVPVSWRDPKPGDYRRFAEALAAHRDRRVLVQCAANYRAAAMTYLFRVLEEGVAEDVARRDLYSVWTPNPTWRAYIATASELAGPTDPGRAPVPGKAGTPR